MNRGDKPLTSGNHILATITMTAKQDMNLKTKAADSFLTIENGILIGPNYSTVKAKINEEPQIPDAPAVKDVTLKQEDVTMTITNEFLPTDDGTNVEKMINEKKFDGLFNGNKADGGSGAGFDLAWDIKGSNFNEEYVTLPLTLHAA